MPASHMVFTYYLTVDHVHDGDTIMGTLDMGLRIHMEKASVRLGGLNAAEVGTPDGQAALAYVENLIHPGDVVRVESESWEHDNYGRIIGTIYPVGDEESLNAMLLSSGHAVSYPAEGTTA